SAFTVRASLRVTGSTPLSCPDADARAAWIYLRTAHGTVMLRAESPGEAGPGLQEISTDLTEWLHSPLSQDDHAVGFVRGLRCSEGREGRLFIVDSNDVVFRISRPAAAVPVRSRPWAALAAEAPVVSLKIDNRLAAVLPYASSIDTWTQRVAS